MSSDPVRVAQVGLGAWGQNLVRNLDVLGELTAGELQAALDATRQLAGTPA